MASRNETPYSFGYFFLTTPSGRTWSSALPGSLRFE